MKLVHPRYASLLHGEVQSHLWEVIADGDAAGCSVNMTNCPQDHLSENRVIYSFFL